MTNQYPIKYVPTLQNKTHQTDPHFHGSVKAIFEIRPAIYLGVHWEGSVELF